MPNWCYNNLVVIGGKDNVQAFADHYSLSYGSFSFQDVLPMPTDVRHMPDDNQDAVTARLEWCRENWGTKWDACDVAVTAYPFEEYSIVDIRFDTAWSPPFPVLNKLGQDWSKLRFLVRCQMDASCLEDPFISQYHPEHGFRDVLIERWTPVLVESLATGDASLDVHRSEEVRPEFLEEWGQDVMIHNAMMLLGFGDEERQAMIKAGSEDVHDVVVA